MRVLLVEHYLPDSVYTLELGRELKNHCDLSIFCRKDAKGTESGITWIPEFYSGGSRKGKAMLAYGSSLWKLARTIRKGNYDVVHVQTFKNAKYEIPLYDNVRKYAKKLVHTVHNVLPHEISRSDFALYRRFYHACDELIVHNEASKQCLMEKFQIAEHKIHVIAHGAYQTYPAKRRAAKNSGRKNFLQFGFIRKYKGIDILLQSIALIPQEIRKDLHVTIAGKQYPKLDDTDYRSKIRELGIEESVSFCPEHIPDERVPELFHDADFLLFPYREIYGSGSLLLAYTYEKPVIVSDIPAFLEETGQGKTGFVFQSESPQALADAICEAAQCDSRKIGEYQTAISQLVEQKYNWKRSAAKTAECYR